METKPLKEQYAGFTRGTRQWVIDTLKLSQDVTDTEIFDKLETVASLIKATNVKLELKEEIATLSIDKVLRDGMIESEDRDNWIKLATSDCETTLSIITQRHADKLETLELIKLSGHELYMTGKMERLAKTSPYHFEKKWKEHLNFRLS